MNMLGTPRFSVCIPAGGKWDELSSHVDVRGGLEALKDHRLDNSDAALWDWSTGEQVTE